MFSSSVLTATGDVKMIWPLCYIGCICGLFDDPSYESLSVIKDLVYNDLLVYQKSTESGKDWEIIVLINILLRMNQAKFSGTAGAFNLIPIKSYPEVIYLVLPPQITTIELAHQFIMKQLNQYKKNIVIIMTPSYCKFPDFDGFICSKVDNVQITGYQVKLGRSSPKNSIPKWMHKGLLLRGNAAKFDKTKEGWEYVNKDNILKLLGCSLESTYPDEWPELPDSDEFD